MILDSIIEIFPVQDWDDIALLSDNEMDLAASKLAESTDNSITVPKKHFILFDQEEVIYG